MPFKPMLAGTHTDVAKLIFPLLASQKLDGLRATVQGGVLLSRSLKPLPNVHVQELYKHLPEGLDGELVVGDPFAPDAFRKTTSLVMSDDKPLDFFPGDKLVYHIFDQFGPEGFSDRMLLAAHHASRGGKDCSWVWQTRIEDIEALNAYEADMLSKGAEGVMVRTFDGPYKEGRATEKSGWLVKVKRFVDSEAEITGYFEEMHNENEQEENELGRSKRSSKAEGLVPSGRLGGFHIRDLVTKVDGKVGSGFDDVEKETFWANRDSMIGQIVKYKYFPTGGKDKPRHPIFLGMRDKRDM